ncbi:acyl carrier protein [Bradyrhizobium tropiciagri]|uniref:acyl carrier protein n=1 Tax=Bradyrhizobium tropiciagri TaxID=312253 RepID=UPI00067C862C|nr:phosphopantetheine-binding protein [Bradyrhizobium tropiciagri]
MSVARTDKLESAVVGLLRTLGCDAPTILPVHDLAIDLGIDSTELIELAILVRDEFGLSIKPDLRSMGTVSELTAELSRLLKQEQISV